MTFVRNLFTLTALCALSLPLAANAQKPEWYVGMGGGYNNVMDSDVEGAGTTTTVEMDDGWAGILSFGARTGYNLRPEIELGYRQNEVDNVGGAGVSDGEYNSWSALANIIYEFRNQSDFTPYVGVGAGIARLNMDNVAVGGVSVVDDNETSPVAQGLAGVTYRAHRNVELFLDYRYLTAIDASFTNAAGVDVDADYDNNTVLAGVRYVFGPRPTPAPVAVPAPMPMPEPVQAEPSSYMVFFDFDRADITPEAHSIIAKAVAETKDGKKVRLNVTGHADRSGTDAYNMRLSERRAAAVQREMTKLGLNAADIATYAKGETSPLVPTEDGVKEPQNRRAEIVFE